MRLFLRCLLFQLCVLGSFSYASASDEVSDSIDVTSIIRSVTNHFKTTEQAIDSLSLLAWDWRYDNTEYALPIINYCVRVFEKMDDQDRLMTARTTKCMILINMYKFPEAKKLCLDGIRQATKLNTPKKLHLFYSHYATVLSHINIDSSFFYAQKALSMSRSMKDTSKITEDLNNIASLYHDIGEDELAITYYQKILYLAKKIDYKAAVAGTHNNIANSYTSMHNRDKALYHFHQALKIKKEMQDAYGTAGTLVNIGLLYFRMNENYEAQNYYEQALQIFESIEAPGKIADVLINMSLNCNKQEEHQKALRYALQAQSILNEAGIDANQTANFNLYKQLYVSYKALGYTKKALAAHEKYTEAREFKSSENYKDQLSKYQIQFETSLKDKEIKLLQSDNKLSHVVIKRKELLQKLLIVSIASVLIIVLFLLLGYRRKRKSEALLQGKNMELNNMVQEKKELLDELHHRVKNNLQMISSFLEMKLFKSKKNRELEAVLRDSIGRVQAMGLIHKVTSECNAVEFISSAEYVENLLLKLKESQPSINRTVKIVQNIEGFNLRTSQATWIGLIINELITNSFKYAFISKDEAEVSVDLKLIKEEVFLSVTDNGTGFSSEMEKGTGLNLVHAFVRRMKGSINCQSSSGVSYQISLPIEV